MARSPCSVALILFFAAASVQGADEPLPGDVLRQGEGEGCPAGEEQCESLSFRQLRAVPTAALAQSAQPDTGGLIASAEHTLADGNNALKEMQYQNMKWKDLDEDIKRNDYKALDGDLGDMKGSVHREGKSVHKMNSDVKGLTSSVDQLQNSLGGHGAGAGAGAGGVPDIGGLGDFGVLQVDATPRSAQEGRQASLGQLAQQPDTGGLLDAAEHTLSDGNDALKEMQYQNMKWEDMTEAVKRGDYGALSDHLGDMKASVSREGGDVHKMNHDVKDLQGDVDQLQKSLGQGAPST